MEENRHSPERLGQITPKKERKKKKNKPEKEKKKKFQRTLSRVGELLFGGAARRLQCAPPEAPFARHGACPIL